MIFIKTSSVWEDLDKRGRLQEGDEELGRISDRKKIELGRMFEIQRILVNTDDYASDFRIHLSPDKFRVCVIPLSR